MTELDNGTIPIKNTTFRTPPTSLSRGSESLAASDSIPEIPHESLGQLCWPRDSGVGFWAIAV